MMKIFVLLSACVCFAFSAVSNKEIEDYKMSLLKGSKQASVKSIKVLSRSAMAGYKDWEAVTMLVEFTIDKGGKKQTVKASDMVFIKGDYLVDDLINVKTQKSVKEIFKPKPDASYYDPKYLVAGNPSAANKVLVFSDPLCPFCRDIVPDIISAAVKNPNNIAIYHYSFPLLTIHPSSELIVKAEIAHRGSFKNKADLLTKIYNTNVDSNDVDEASVASKLSSELGVKVQKSDFHRADVLKEYEDGIQKAFKLIVRGTPTIYVNGELDQAKSKIQQILIKELK